MSQSHYYNMGRTDAYKGYKMDLSEFTETEKCEYLTGWSDARDNMERNGLPY